MTELEDLILGIIAQRGCLSIAEIGNAVSLNGYNDGAKVQEALDQLVADGLLELVPKQEKYLPPAHGKPGDIRPGTVIRVSPEKYCIPQPKKSMTLL
ncbi:MAG: hypothetical protein ABSG17_06390 [Spirochaetia bacterium]